MGLKLRSFFNSTALLSLQRVSDYYLICILILDRLRRLNERPPKPLITAM